jgi:hypothetical protein
MYCRRHVPSSSSLLRSVALATVCLELPVFFQVGEDVLCEAQQNRFFSISIVRRKVRMYDIKLLRVRLQLKFVSINIHIDDDRKALRWKYPCLGESF